MHVLNNLGKGGLENGLVNLVAGSDHERFEHVICTMRGLGPNVERLPHGTEIVSLRAQGAHPRIQTAALMRTIRSLRPEVVHSRNWGAIEAVVAARLAGSCAVIHSEHGLETDASAPEPRRRIWFRRMAYQLADRVLSVSEQLRVLHARRTGFPERRITVIHNGVDRSRFFPDDATRRRVRSELGVDTSTYCIGCVANLLPVKDHLTLLQSMVPVAAAAGDWRLIIIGEGPERPRLEAFVNERPDWQRRVNFLGSVGHVPELLKALDVFVLPSIAEGICNSLLEAMATGLPVIATAVGGNPEVVIDGDSGLLFPAGDDAALAERLLRLRTQDALRAELGRSAMLRVRDQFSMDSMIRSYEQVYDESSRAAGSLPLLASS